eukprot:gene34224-42200_t
MASKMQKAAGKSDEVEDGYAMLEASNSYKVLPHSHSMTDLNGAPGPPLITRIKNHKLHAINEMRSIKSERNNLALSMPKMPPIPVRSRMIQLP